MADDKQLLASFPLVEESAEVVKSPRTTGFVRVTTSAEHDNQRVAADLAIAEVSVERVPVGQWVDGPLPPWVEGDTTIFPVIEEVAVVQMRYRLVEEVRITRQTHSQPFAQDVEVRRTRVSVERGENNP